MEINEASVYYKWGTWTILEDGALFMRTSVYRPSSHSSGKFRVEPDSPEFAFWMWLVKDKKPMRRIGEKDYASIQGSELEALREEYRQSSAGSAL